MQAAAGIIADCILEVILADTEGSRRIYNQSLTGGKLPFKTPLSRPCQVVLSFSRRHIRGRPRLAPLDNRSINVNHGFFKYEKLSASISSQ